MDASSAKDVASRMLKGIPVLMAEYAELKAYVANKGLDPDIRMDVLRPMVFTDWEEVQGWAMDAYEEILCELADGDPRIDEFYSMFGVGDDGLCKCERRWLESIGEKGNTCLM